MKSNQQQVDARLASSPQWREKMRYYTYLKPGIWLMSLPLVGPVLQRAWIKGGTDANWFIPVNEAIPTGTRYVLPEDILKRLLREADGIFVMTACPCRTAFRCRQYPRNFGCLQLGPASRDIPRDIGKTLTLEGGLAHIDRGLSMGMTPTILYMESEAEIFQVEKRRLLTVCFCCECCCDVRLLLRDGPDRYWDLYNHRLPGLEVVVSSLCTLCGECVSVCYGGERVIAFGFKRVEISDRCIGCGLCVTACQEDAISLKIDLETDLIEALMERVAVRTQIGSI